MMKNYLLFPAIPFICFIFIGFASAKAEDDMGKIRKEQTAMSKIIAQFSKERNICSDDKTELKFAISPYLAGKDQTPWPQDMQKALAACQEKYMIEMKQNDAQTVYVYCYDSQAPKLVAATSGLSESRKECTKMK
jgi:hypothetical protein